MRAKFLCQWVRNLAEYQPAANGVRVVLKPAPYGNDDWSGVGNGEIVLEVDRAEAVTFFEPGKSYELDIRPAAD